MSFMLVPITNLTRLHMKRPFNSINKLSYALCPRGFTLVELLVVITIVTLLISLLLPAVSKARESAFRTVCLSQMHQIAIAGLTYAQDHKFAMPACDSARPTAWMDQNVALSSTYPSTVVKFGVQRLWDGGYIPSKKKNSSNAIINDYRLAVCPGKVDHYNPAVAPNLTYLAHPSSYIDLGWTTYSWASSNYFEIYPTPAVGGASFGIYYVNADKVDPTLTLLSDVVTVEYNLKTQAWVSSNDHYPQKQNNHFNFTNYQPFGGNAVSYDGHGGWISYDTGVMDNSGNTSTWQINTQTANSCFPTNTQFPASNNAYYFANPITHGYPTGESRGWFQN